MEARKSVHPLLRSIGVGLAVLAALVIYAYGFQVTQVNLEETRSPRRQEQLVRILRALAHPDIFTFQQIEVRVEHPIMVPCPASGYQSPEPTDRSQPYLVIEPPCAAPGEVVRVSGYNFEPNSEGPLSFIPPSGVTLSLGTLKTDAQGSFSMEVKVPKRAEEVAQTIRAVTRQRVGAPQFSKSAIETGEKIIETVFLALLATTIGTLLAVPLSFFAAKNLMKDVKSPLASVMLSILLIPVGVYAGIVLTRLVKDLAQPVSVSVLADVLGVISAPLVLMLAFRWAIPQEEMHKPAWWLQVLRWLALAIAAVWFIFGLEMLSRLAIRVGDALQSILGGWAFLGKFVRDVGDILGMTLVLLVAMLGAGLVSGLGDRLGKQIAYRMAVLPAKGLTLLLSAAAGAVLLILMMAGLNWFYEFNDPAVRYTYPGAIGAVAGGLLALRLKPRDDLPIGIVIYYASRTLWNALRSIEALVWVIVFVVWVGIGPFAGVLALSLHTIAALAKLYSEQVESIMPGPLEAVMATGANRLQTVIYAVIPQIIPPYISFTMYRWDINVRMSTIIGFAGGGGIGFLLYQNINLLNYRAASTQMLAIAIVVATMDYLSSKMREKTI